MEKSKNKTRKVKNVEIQNNIDSHGPAGGGAALKARLLNKEWVLSSIQYATGWLLMILFTYGFILQFFIEDIPYIPVVSDIFVPLISVTFFTHAALGVRSTLMRYRLWREWVDLTLFPLWIFVCVTFVLTYARLLQNAN